MTSNVIPFGSRSRTESLFRFPSVLRPEDRAVYTVREVSQLLAVSLGGTYALVREGRIPAIKLGGRWVIPKRRFHAWLEQCTEDGDDSEGWR
jgi:excisionase family DNA binding protein